MFHNYLLWARTRALCHLSGKNNTSLESLCFSASIERVCSGIGKIVFYLQLSEWNKFANCLQAKRTLSIKYYSYNKCYSSSNCGPVLFQSIFPCVFCTNGDILAILSRWSFQITLGGGMVLKKSSTTRQISFFVVNRFPHNSFFSSGNNQKSQGVRSGDRGDGEELWDIHPRWIWKCMCRCEAEHCRDAESNYRANVVACNQRDTGVCKVRTDNTRCSLFDWRVTRSGIPCPDSWKKLESMILSGKRCWRTFFFHAFPGKFHVEVSCFNGES